MTGRASLAIGMIFICIAAFTAHALFGTMRSLPGSQWFLCGLSTRISHHGNCPQQAFWVEVHISASGLHLGEMGFQ